jgi:hypothetical protein
MIVALGAKIVKELCDYPKVTHFIPYSIRRTVKFMAACSATSNIVNVQWLYDSFSRKQLLSCDEYLIVKDTVGEKRYKFSMKQTMENGKLARAAGGIFQNHYVYLCNGILGKKRMPSSEEFKILFGGAGATPISLKTIENCDASKLVIITSYPETKTQLKSKALEKAIQNGAKKITCIDFFNAILKQKFEFNAPALDQKTSLHVTSPVVVKNATPLSKPNSQAKLSNQVASPPTKKKAASIIKNHGFDVNFGRVTHVVDASIPAIIENKYQNENPFETPKKKMATKNETQMIKLFETAISRSPERTISNQNIGDISRQYLGDNGTFEIFKCLSTNIIIVRYLNHAGEKTFEAEAPQPEKSHAELQGNAGFDCCFFWEAYNKVVASGGTIIKDANKSSNPTMCRRFYFWFRSKEQLTSVLSHLLYHDMDLLEEFFRNDGRFFAAVETKPPHEQVQGEDDMEVDDDDMQVRQPAKTLEEEQDEFGMNPHAMSQAM